MIIGIPSTGSAGLINTISAFSRKAIVVGVLGTIATTGWVIQGLGHAFYYRQVSPGCVAVPTFLRLFQIWTHHHDAGHSFAKAKGELAQHGKPDPPEISSRAYAWFQAPKRTLHGDEKEGGTGQCVSLVPDVYVAIPVVPVRCLTL